VTVIHMTPKLDGGPCLASAKTPIQMDDDAPALEQRLSHLGVAPVCQAIAQLAEWDGQSSLGSPQDSGRATRAPRLKKSDGLVDWTQPAERIFNQSRALRPWPGTYTYWLRDAQPLLLLLEKVSVATEPLLACQARPGEVVRVTNHAITVATGAGSLVIEQLKPAGKRVLETAEFLRGYPVRPGDRLGDAAAAR
jgi:methionyl-tRNA formyltransferase